MSRAATWLAIAALPAAVLLFFAALLASQSAAAPHGICPGFPEMARLVTYDGNLTDLTHDGKIRAKIRADECSCAGTAPHEERAGWTQVYYLCRGFGQSFGAGIPNNSRFANQSVSVWLTNGSRLPNGEDFLGPLLNATGGTVFWWDSVLAEQNSTRRNI